VDDGYPREHSLVRDFPLMPRHWCLHRFGNPAQPIGFATLVLCKPVRQPWFLLFMIGKSLLNARTQPEKEPLIPTFWFITIGEMPAMPDFILFSTFYLKYRFKLNDLKKLGRTESNIEFIPHKCLRVLDHVCPLVSSALPMSLFVCSDAKDWKMAFLSVLERVSFVLAWWPHLALQFRCTRLPSCSLI
jgi:hypothetical protein